MVWSRMTNKRHWRVSRAVTGWGLHPLENAAFYAASVKSTQWRILRRGGVTELRKIETGPGLVFDVLVAGLADGPLVLLLHGFAESFHMRRSQLPASASADQK